MSFSGFRNGLKKFFGFVSKEAAANPKIVQDVVVAVATKNPAPLIADAEQIVDNKTKQ